MVIIEYKGAWRQRRLRVEVLVEEYLLVEAKSTEHIMPLHKAQLHGVT